MGLMNLPLVFRLQAVINAINGVIFWLASAAMLEMAIMETTIDLVIMAQVFTTMFIVIAIVGWQLPGLAGDNLAKAAKTFIIVNLIWSATLVCHLLTGAISGNTPVINIALNLLFALLYYLKSR